MPKIVFNDPDSTTKNVNVAAGTSVMEAAVANNIPQVESRLSCRISMSDALDGIRVQLPG